MDPETSEALFIGWWAVLGLMVGSFLNVVIARLPEEGESVARPVRSRCPHCRTTLRWYENLPVLSWLVLRARCRTCRAPISWRYPLVELLTSGLFLWVVSERPGDPALVALQSVVLAGLAAPLEGELAVMARVAEEVDGEDRDACGEHHGRPVRREE